jgi:putative phosphoesterase
MQIAVISDTHNAIGTLEKAIREIKRRAITHLVHCGDLTYSYTLQPCQGLRIYLAYGNGDLDQHGIALELQLLNTESISGPTLEFSIDGQRFFVAHGYTPRLIQTALANGTYDWVLQGHTHRFKDEIYGQTHWINPGALGGSRFDAASFVVLDTSNRSIERIMIKEV